jgi:hypothetical protein
MTMWTAEELNRIGEAEELWLPPTARTELCGPT